MIDSRAIVGKLAEIDSGVSIGPFTIVEDGATIGANTWIGPHVVIRKNTTIGRRNKIFQFSSIGEDPQYADYQGEETFLEIGDDNYSDVSRWNARREQLGRYCWKGY